MSGGAARVPPPAPSKQRARSVLVVDDDAFLRQAVLDYLRAHGYQTLGAGSLAEARKVIADAHVDVLVLDEKLPDGEGHNFCGEVREAWPTKKIIFVTAYPEFSHAVRALREGAYDYLPKPFEIEALRIAVSRCFEVIGLESIERREQVRRQRDADEALLVGESAAFAEVRALVELAAASDATVLVTGETGTGKSFLARAIHARGPRRTGAFVPLSMAALPDNLVEAELFGWERGAFTGATAAHDGAFTMADGGTLFLDEIGELGLHLQPKLLAVLEDRVVRRLGARHTHTVDPRIVAATNADLGALVEQKRFRADLYYRLAVVHIHLPPLRERPEDIEPLSRHLLAKICGRREPPTLGATEVERLAAYPWPGNVRELRNVLERAVLLQRGELRPSALIGASGPGPGPSSGGPSAPGDDAPFPTLEELEAAHIAEALRRTGGNLAQSARLLGISLSTLKRRVRSPD